jgi:hypothetical protein
VLMNRWFTVAIASPSDHADFVERDIGLSHLTFSLSRRGPTVSLRIQSNPLADRGRAGGWC